MAVVSRRTSGTTVSTLPRSREGAASSSFTRRASQHTQCSLPGIRDAAPSVPAPTLNEIQFLGSQPRNFDLGGKQGNVVIASSDIRVHKGWRLVSIDGTQLGLHSDAQIRLLLRQMEQKRAKYTLCFAVKKSGPCDKCDGDHHADDCPHFKKARDKHRDAWDKYGSKGGKDGKDVEAPVVVRNARVVRQPGDGSCLFHSLAHGVGSSAGKLRGQLASFVEESPAAEIAGTPVKDWVNWDCGLTPSAYAKRMRGSGQWGGAIELAIFSHTNRVAVCVYEPNPGGGYRRISVFGSADAPKQLHLLYGGRVHYDALEIR